MDSRTVKYQRFKQTRSILTDDNSELLIGDERSKFGVDETARYLSDRRRKSSQHVFRRRHLFRPKFERANYLH